MRRTLIAAISPLACTLACMLVCASACALAAPARAGASVAGARPQWTRTPAAVVSPHAGTGSPDWLAEINRYRVAAGLAAVTEQTAWDTGIDHHLTYLEKTPASDRTGQYASAHTENPASPYYTSDGATEAGYSDLALGGATSALGAVDGWLASPFHAVGMLRAQLTQVALGIDSRHGFAGLDVIQGIDPNQPAATSPILFPGPGVTTDLVRYSGTESPDPRETCGWQGYTSLGLPLIALLPTSPDAALAASLTGPGKTESSAAGTLCVVDEHTYHSSDPVYGPAGASILSGDHAVFLIPRTPLSAGPHTARITQPGQPDITWSFTATAPANPGPPALGCSPCVSRRHPAAMSVRRTTRAGHLISINIAGWRAFAIALTIRTSSGRVVLHSGWHLGAGQWTLRPRLPASATRRGDRLRITARFAVVGRHVTVTRTVRFT